MIKQRGVILPVYFYMAGVLILFTVGLGTGYKLTKSHYVTIIAKMELRASDERQKALETVNKALTDNESLKSTLEGKKHEAENVIDVLMHNKPGSVSLPRTACPTGNQISSASSVPVTIEASGVLLGETERILDADRLRVKGIVSDCEREIIDLNVIKEWAKAQGK